MTHPTDTKRPASLTAAEHGQHALPRRQLLVGDARTRLGSLPNSSVDMVLTSPPYFRLRNYNVADQLGNEASVEAWVDGLRDVCRELRRVLVPTGSLWLNLGDTYATHPRQGAARKSLLLGPERLALALTTDGWTLRNKIVWQKSNPVPTSTTDRLTTTWEVIYVFANASRYYFDLDSLRIPHRSRAAPRRTPSPVTNERTWRGQNAATTSGLDQLKRLGIAGHPLGKNPGDVWTIATSRHGAGHHATFPLDLATRAITAGCPSRRCVRCHAPWRQSFDRTRHHRGPPAPTCTCPAASEPGLVLDPFMGSGTTAIVAEQLERDWLGIELNPTFAQHAQARIKRARQTALAASDAAA